MSSERDGGMIASLFVTLALVSAVAVGFVHFDPLGLLGTSDATLGREFVEDEPVGELGAIHDADEVPAEEGGGQEGSAGAATQGSTVDEATEVETSVLNLERIRKVLGEREADAFTVAWKKALAEEGRDWRDGFMVETTVNRNEKEATFVVFDRGEGGGNYLARWNQEKGTVSIDSVS
jgi:hypothetical protein